MLPQRLSAELARAAQLGVKALGVGEAGFDEVINAGTVKWAVTESGQLLVMPHSVAGREISHAVLTGGNSVLAAGQADIAGSGGKYFLLELTNHSGHFQPSAASLELARRTFASFGIK